MPPHRKRKSRSHSRSPHWDDRDSPSSPNRRPSMDTDKLESILQTLQSLQNDVTNWPFLSPVLNNRKRPSSGIVLPTTTPFFCWDLKTSRSILSMKRGLLSHQTRQNCQQMRLLSHQTRLLSHQTRLLSHQTKLLSHQTTLRVRAM